MDTFEASTGRGETVASPSPVSGASMASPSWWPSVACACGPAVDFAAGLSFAGSQPAEVSTRPKDARVVNQREEGTPGSARLGTSVAYNALDKAASVRRCSADLRTVVDM